MGQLQALKEHEADLGTLERDLDELAGGMREGDKELHERVSKLRKHFVALRDRLNRVELVTEALFAHFESKGELDRDRLRTLMDELDEKDGKRDGRVRKRVT